VHPRRTLAQPPGRWRHHCLASPPREPPAPPGRPVAASPPSRSDGDSNPHQPRTPNPKPRTQTQTITFAGVSPKLEKLEMG
jgi:hypothetical protein